MQFAPRRNLCPFHELGYLRLFQFCLAFDVFYGSIFKGYSQGELPNPQHRAGKTVKKPREGVNRGTSVKSWKFSRKAERKWKSLQSFQAKNEGTF
jgi:hypothetical protein